MAWADQLDNETRAYAATKGWDRLEGDTAISTIFKSYQNLEKTRPTPDTILSPRTAADYSFDGIKYGATDPDPAALDLVRSIAIDLKLPPATARELATRLFASGHAEETAQAEAAAAALQQSTERLKTTWGDKYDANVAAATNAFEALKLPKEATDALVASLGLDGAMQLGQTLGARMGEAPLLTGGSVDQVKTQMTREQALTERNRLTGDPVFGKKLMDGDPEARKQLEDVSRAILTDPKNPSGFIAPPENFGRTKENPQGVFETPRTA